MTTKEMSDFINSLWCWARCTEEEQRKLSEIADYLSNRGNEKNDLAVDVPDNNVGKIDKPSATPQEPKTGHWIGIDEEPHEDYECDKCGYTISTYTANIEPYTEYKYCPNCGAKMVESQESEDKE